ncbi:MAG: hypothetical protein JWR35_2498 [Marmoricola sp.]|nr:hypothetical protein [Marmoricola sp.]
MKIFTSFAVTLLMAVSGVALFAGSAQAAYPGSIHVVCHFGVTGAQAPAPNRFQAGIQVDVPGNAVARGTFIVIAHKLDGSINRTSTHAYTSGKQKFANSALPKGNYRVNVKFVPNSASYKSCLLQVRSLKIS